MSHTVLSKRVLTELVRGGHVSGWDDPRMPTIAGLRRRGVPPAAIRRFVNAIGVARADSLVDVAMFEHAIRDDLNQVASRRMAVLRPLKVIIENYPERQTEELDAVNNPEDPAAGSRKVTFCRELYIECDDFMEIPAKGFFRLSPGKEVRLRYAYFVTCREAVKNASGEVVELRCTYDPQTRGGNSPPDGRKVKATLHWVAAPTAVKAEVRLVNHLFSNPAPNVANFTAELNPKSLEILAGTMVEPAAVAVNSSDPLQFERQGYFVRDPDSAPGRPVFVRTVGLRDTFAKSIASAKR
jgi:glutaminyl-tRNA synthetase